MIGQKFGRFTVLDILTHGGNKHAKCVCSCGTIKTVLLYNLKNGNTQSCGCLHRDVSANLLTKHGMCNTDEHRVWIGILARCYNPNRKAYPNYGGRGITVCEEWRHSFEAFVTDMGKKPFADAQIDRIDNNKGYSPDNCRWTTCVQNCNNRRDNRLLKFGGTTKTMAEWSKSTGIKYQTLDTRRRAGWSDDKILTEPIRYTPRHHATSLAISLPHPEDET